MGSEITPSRVPAVQGMLAALPLLTALIWGCGQGYPTDNLVNGESMSAEEHIDRLNELGKDVARQVRHSVALAGNCLLRFTPEDSRSGSASVDMPLMTLQSSSKTDAQSRVITVAVQTRGAAGATAREVYETRLWHEAVAFQSHLTQLRGLCAESLAPTEPA
jgi:hypothetical protein